MTRCLIEMPYENEEQPRSVVPAYLEQVKAVTVQHLGPYALDQTRDMHAHQSRRPRRIH